MFSNPSWATTMAPGRPPWSRPCQSSCLDPPPSPGSSHGGSQVPHQSSLWSWPTSNQQLDGSNVRAQFQQTIQWPPVAQSRFSTNQWQPCLVPVLKQQAGPHSCCLAWKPLANLVALPRGHSSLPRHAQKRRCSRLVSLDVPTKSHRFWSRAFKHSIALRNATLHLRWVFHECVYT